uniref:CTR2 n=1 Tax=Arundo donax TaxID=35708 RepID=A0A0A9GG85_ARUDO
MFNRRLSSRTSFAPLLCKSLYKLPLDKYSVTIDKFGGSVTAPMNRTIFGCLRLFMIATSLINSLKRSG